MKKLIDLTVYEEVLEKTVQRAREKRIMLPTFEQMKDPKKIPSKIKDELKNVGLWDVNSINLFRTTWKNEATKHGGLYNDLPNYIELPPEITGVDARIIALAGKWFPTGAHKVGATYGCLVPRLITGQFDPTYHQAVWPSTGNYCRGGAYNAHLLSCQSIAILPEEMSQERFEWLKQVAGEVIATPGCESNVKEIFDKTWELRKTRDNVVIFNQFDEFGNPLWHYEVTGSAMAEILKEEMGPNDKFAGVCLTSGSAGTLGSGEYLKDIYPNSKIVVGEALQCPTLLNNGFGGHRIEGIGDKHVPWIHNVKNTDMVIAIDDEDSMAMMRLFNEPSGIEYLRGQGISEELIEQLPLVGISGAANILMAIKFAKYYELGKNDVVMTCLTDSAEMYESRIQEMKEARNGCKYDKMDAAMDHRQHINAIKTDSMLELSYLEKKRIHNLKYYTWIEQQARDLDDLNDQWYDYDNYWGQLRELAPQIDKLINQFNDKVGLLKDYE